MARLFIKPKTVCIRGKKIRRSGFYVKDGGAPGRTPESSRFATFGGNLAGWSKSKSTDSRRNSLSKSARKRGGGRRGWLSVMRALLQLSNISTDNDTRRIAKLDRDWVRRTKLGTL